MKLEELLGTELYAQVQAKLDEINGKEPDKLKHVRYADLSEGKYVGKGKFDALQLDFDNQAQELKSANDLIAELKKGTEGNGALQEKISGYEAQLQQLQEKYDKSRLDYALQLALRDAKALDPDYLAFKLREKYAGDELKLEENGKIKGIDDKLAGLKTQFPTQFEKDGQKKVEPNRLPPSNRDNGGGEAKTLADALKLAYEEQNE